jgi:hypothetical protein
MNYIRRIAAALTALTATLLATAAAAPAAFAMQVPPPGELGSNPVGHAPIAPAHTQTIVIGGMPGWQIALIAVGAALLAGTVAVLLDRARIARRNTVAAAA